MPRSGGSVVPAGGPRDSELRAFEPDTHPAGALVQGPGSRSPGAGGRGGEGAATSFIHSGCSLWILILKAPGNDPKEPQGIRGKPPPPPVRHSSPFQCRNAAKVRGVRGRGGGRGLKIPKARRVCGSPRQTRLRARTPGGGGAPEPEESSEPPCRAARLPGRGPRLPWVWARASAPSPSPLTPYFLPLVETASLSLFPATEFMVAFPEEGAERSPGATSTRSSPQRGLPVAGGCLLVLKSRLLSWGRGHEGQRAPEVTAPICRRGWSGWLVLSSNAASPHPLLRLQPHALFPRSHPDRGHFPQPSKSVFLHEGKRRLTIGARGRRGEGGRAPRRAPASEPAVGTRLLPAARELSSKKFSQNIKIQLGEEPRRVGANIRRPAPPDSRARAGKGAARRAGRRPRSERACAPGRSAERGDPRPRRPGACRLDAAAAPARLHFRLRRSRLTVRGREPAGGGGRKSRSLRGSSW